ncbi:metallophosphoesterase family protein [Nitrogeniibacter mangrovi]|uniref:Phosphoesterase n=1 Tax=Nitrogeniibacter mangrovi TaxID=2016596 RepID=A0A6C1B9Z6_9RHOO|nr:metallophosphoesterase family protein [Nitrogeniibacter mangrovi]
MRIGLISDTHGLLRAEVLDYLAGCDHIIHAGDIGDPAILETLAAMAPLTAVRGNNDSGDWAAALPARVSITLGTLRVHVLHDIAELDPAAAGDARVVVCGHSHRPAVREADGRLCVNPGSAGRRRFRLPIAAGELRVSGASVRANLREFPAR